MTTTAPCKIVILIFYVKMCHWDGSMYAKEKFEEAKRGNQNGNRKGTNGQIMIPKTLHRKLIIEQQESLLKRGVNSGALEGYTVPVPLVAPSVIFVLQTR